MKLTNTHTVGDLTTTRTVEYDPNTDAVDDVHWSALMAWLNFEDEEPAESRVELSA